MTNEKTLKTTTACHNCVFANIEDTIQIGCKLGRVETFTKRGEVELVTEDGITAADISRFCLAKRDDIWNEAVKEKGLEPLEQVMSEFQIAFDFIMVEVGDSYPLALNRLGQSLEHIKNNSLAPKTVIIATCNPEVLSNIKHYVDTVKNTLESTDIKYLVITSVEEETVCERLVDIGVAKSSNQFYSAYPMGEYIPSDFISTVNHYINEKLNIVSVINAYEHYNLVVQTKLHKLVRGNDGGYIEDKIEALAEEQDAVHTIHSWEDINV